MFTSMAVACVLLGLLSSQVPAAAPYMPAVAVMLAGGGYLALTLTRQMGSHWRRAKAQIVL
jgi:hypothetical protein